mmetsp:Transcript_8388/g.12174  ORF Transcript_8388/g.12174 Transcript_8388/m.12174 type:complete len:353 (+) Transcript_8388:217-1275(+)
MRHSIIIFLLAVSSATGFLSAPNGKASIWGIRMSSYSSDSSDYSPKESDYEPEDDLLIEPMPDEYEVDSEFDSQELNPVPMSKNAGNRFIVFFWDRLLDSEKREPVELHESRIMHTEDHVLYCRQFNLYNETFNSDSMVDVLWSRQVLSSDLTRVIGQALCLESTKLSYAMDFLKKEPLLNFFTGGDISEVPIYRWRQYRDYTMMVDDGNNYGYPCMSLTFDEDAETGVGNIRQETNETHLEYLMRSERVIAAGPLHLCTELKDDPSSIPVGDLIMFNAKDREDAIDFVEEDPLAVAGLYKSMQVHFYNNLDVTGKFVAEHRLEEEPIHDMKEYLEMSGYPTSDEETPWLNF